MQLRAVARGKLRQLTTAGGEPVDVKLYACRVVKEPYDRNGKTYLGLDLSATLGDLDALRQVDDFVAKHASNGYSPLMPGGNLVVKLTASTKYENSDGNPAARWSIAPDAYVDLVLRPGAFGDFGYCWLVHRIKPHVTAV